MTVRTAHLGSVGGLAEAARPAPVGQSVILVAGARAGAVNALVNALFGGGQRFPHTPRETYLVVRSPSATDLRLADSGIGRPPRRVEVVIADPMLDLFTVVAARAATSREADHQLMTQLVDRSQCLVLVTDGRFAYQPAELDLLRAARARGHAIYLAVVNADEGTAWADVVRANQSRLARDFTDLALKQWYPVTRSGSGVPGLRTGLFAWAVRQRRPGASGRRGPAIRMSATAAASSWQRRLATEIDRARREVSRRAAAALRAAAAPTRVARGLGPALQDASLTLDRDLCSSADEVLTRVLSGVLAAPPAGDVLDRVRIALRREVALRTSDRPRCYRSLRITRTGIVAVATSRDPVPALAAHAKPVGGVFPPLGIGLTPNCLPTEGDAEWVRRAVAALEVELIREVSHQFTHLHQALAELLVEAIDHDLLLV